MGPQYPEPGNPTRENGEGSPQIGKDLTSRAVARKNGRSISTPKRVCGMIT